MKLDSILSWLRKIPSGAQWHQLHPAEEGWQSWRLARLFKESDDYIRFAPFSCPCFTSLECPMCGENARMEEALAIGDDRFFGCPTCGTHIRAEHSSATVPPADDFAVRHRFQCETDLFGLVTLAANAAGSRRGGSLLHVGQNHQLIAAFIAAFGNWRVQSVDRSQFGMSVVRPGSRNRARAFDKAERHFDAVFCDALSAAASPVAELERLSELLAPDGRLCLGFPNAAAIYRLDNNFRIFRLIEPAVNFFVPSRLGIERLFSRAGLPVPVIFEVGNTLCAVIDREGGAHRPLDSYAVLDQVEAYLELSGSEDVAIALAARKFVDAVDIGDHATAIRLRPFLAFILEPETGTAKRVSAKESLAVLKRHPITPRVFFCDGMLQINALNQPEFAARQFNGARAWALEAFSRRPDLFAGDGELAECAWVHEVLGLARAGKKQAALDCAAAAQASGLSDNWGERLRVILMEQNLSEKYAVAMGAPDQ